MLAQWCFAACIGLLPIATAVLGQVGGDVPPHHFIPVWEPHPNRPNPVHQQFDPSISLPDSLRDTAASRAAVPPETLRHPIQAGQGPLPLHSYLFQPVDYPLHMPELQHLYTDSSSPADWTVENAAYTRGRKFARIENRPLLFRPEPRLLESIWDTVARDLRSHNVAFKRAVPQSGYTEGVFLWPPLERGDNGRLQMPAGVLEPRLSDIPNTRIRSNPASPSLFKLDVTVAGQTRRILATRAHIGSFTTLRNGEHLSVLWLFYESRYVRPHGSDPFKTLAFVGAMLLPRETQRVLTTTGSFRNYIPGGFGF